MPGPARTAPDPDDRAWGRNWLPKRDNRDKPGDDQEKGPAARHAHL